MTRPALSLALVFLLVATGCRSTQITYRTADETAATQLAPETQTQLREAAQEGPDQLVAVAIRLADENRSDAPALAAFAARLQPAAAGLLTVTMTDLFPASEADISAAVGSVMSAPASQDTASRPTGHTFFDQW